MLLTAVTVANFRAGSFGAFRVREENLMTGQTEF